jgi:hypothetical protein
MNTRRVLIVLGGLGVLTGTALLVSRHGESRQTAVARVPAARSQDLEKRLTAWLAAKGFKAVPPLRYVGPSEAWYEGQTGTRRPMHVVLYKTPDLHVDVLWTFEGYSWFLNEDRAKADAFIGEVQAWVESR